MLTKKEVADTLGLSCVEKYFLAWLNKYYDVTQLYGCSFVSLPQVFDDFARGATYQNYCYLPRLQDVAEEYGIVVHEYRKLTAVEAVDFLHNQSENKLCLIRVNSSFFTGYKRVAWREDHYVCVNVNLEWLNEYPLSEGRFDEQSFERVYDGALCTYETKNTQAELPNWATSGFAIQHFSQGNIPHGLGQLESAIGVLRITRKRLEKFFAFNDKVRALLSEETALLDKMYFDSRMRQLKGEYSAVDNGSGIIADIQSVVEIENKIAEELSK